MVQAWAPRLANPALVSMAHHWMDSPAYVFPNSLPSWTPTQWYAILDDPKDMEDAAPNTSWDVTTDKSNGEDRAWWRHRDREKKYLRKIRLCQDLLPNKGCFYGRKCMFAHQLQELEVPNEGENGEYDWSHTWRDDKVDRWYGQYQGRELITKYFIHEHIVRENKLLIPDWVHAWAIIHLSHVPVVPPKCGQPDWGMQEALTELAKKMWRGKVPQPVPPVLDPSFVLRLKTAFEAVMGYSSRPSGSLSRRSPPETVLQKIASKIHPPKADDPKAVNHDPKAAKYQDREWHEQEAEPDLPEAVPKTDPDVPDDPKADPQAVQPQADPNMTPEATMNRMFAKIEMLRQTRKCGSGCAAAISPQDPDVELPTSPKSLAAPTKGKGAYPPEADPKRWANDPRDEAYMIHRYPESTRSKMCPMFLGQADPLEQQRKLKAAEPPPLPQQHPEEDDPETVSPKANPKSLLDVSEAVLAENDPKSRPEPANFKQGGN